MNYTPASNFNMTSKKTFSNILSIVHTIIDCSTFVIHSNYVMVIVLEVIIPM